MKIIFGIDAGKSAHYYQREAQAKAFNIAGHECFLWDMQKKSPYDMFDELEADLFIGQTYSITPALIECIKERPSLKVIMKAGDWGYKTNEVSSKYPVLVASQTEKRLTNYLREQTGKPDFLFIHYHPDYLKDTHGYWMEEGYKVISDMNAADIFSFTRGVPQDKYKCDIMFLGGFWGYKAQVLSKWLLPLCETFKYNIKIFGNSSWPCPQYMGPLPDGEEANALASAKICINLHEPHSQEYGWDVVERPFKLASNKCFMMSDYVEGLAKSYHSKYLNLYKKPEDMHYEINVMLKNWDGHSMFRKESIDNMYKETLEKHTYFDRAINLFNNLELDSTHIKLAKDNVISKLGL